MKRFVGFGEILLRCCPPGYLKFAQTNSFNINYTGAEANIAVSLRYMGMDSEFVTKLPNNEIAECALRELAKFGVFTDHVVRGGDRIGVYYSEKGASQRPSRIIYDRKYSSISQAKEKDFDWDEIFENAGWFHFTGITVALSPQMKKICEDACKAAKRHNVKISCDLNYRKNLWSEAEAQAAMQPLMQYVDVLFGNETDAHTVLGVEMSTSDPEHGKINVEESLKIQQQLSRLYGFETVVFTLRGSVSASVNDWMAIMLADEQSYVSKQYRMQIVDRVGGGDSFAAGLIYGLTNGFDCQTALEYAVAASCLKHSIEMDFNISTVEEITSLMRGNETGRVVR